MAPSDFGDNFEALGISKYNISITSLLLVKDRNSTHRYELKGGEKENINNLMRKLGGTYYIVRGNVIGLT